MVKHAFFSFCIFWAAIVVQAAPVSETEARSNVLQFLNTKGKHKIKGVLSLTLAHTIYQGGEKQADGSPMLYIYNVNGNQGFVVASADDVALPILAYSNEGGFSQDNIPDNAKAWLQGYADQITEARASGVSPLKVERSVKANRHSVDYMVKVQWDQTEPYNDQCVFDGHQCVTGCVATAMAQIMYYWGVTGRDGKRFRHGCQALKSYTTESSGYNVPALDAIDSFDWDAIDEGTAAPQSDAAKQAVAQLMRYCGQAAHMNYGTSSSGTSDGEALSGMKKFGYDSDMRYINKSYFSKLGEVTYDEWDEFLYREIRKERPVMMFFGLSTIQMYHCLVCDGYDAENNSFHLNWGWGGNSDGYFVLSAIFSNFGATAKSFSAIVGIEPESSTYGVLSSDGHTLTIYHDNKKEQRPGEIIENYKQNGNLYQDLTCAEVLGDKADEVLTIVIDNSFKYSSIRNINFSKLYGLQEIKGLKYFDTYGVTSFSNMFNDCYSLQHLDLSHFDTSQAIEMESMFFNCFSLQEVDISSFNTSNVRTMDYMFGNCYSLRKLDVNHFDTSNVKGMNRMFQNCFCLAELDLSNFVIKDDPVNPEDEWSGSCYTEGFLFGCSGLRKLHISSSMGLLKESDDDEFSDVPACQEVGPESNPCVIIAPTGFDFGTDTRSTFQWKGGWFHLPYPIGDINHDEEVDVTDVTLLVDYILNIAPCDWPMALLFDTNLPRLYYDHDMEEADVNHDREVNIADVTGIINLILR